MEYWLQHGRRLLHEYSTDNNERLAMDHYGRSRYTGGSWLHMLIHDVSLQVFTPVSFPTFV